VARSTLPPIVWDANCGHRNEVRSDVGGYATNCKTCTAKVWVPKRGAGRASSAREAAGRFGGRSAPTKARMPDRPPGHAVEVDEDQAQPAGPVLPATGAARMAEDIGRMLARRQAARPDEAVLTGTVIPPSRLLPERDPAASAPPGLDGKKPLRAKLKLPGRWERQPDPGYGGHLVPQDAKLAPPCGGCRNGERRAPTWTRASWRLELTAAAVAEGFPAVLDLCGNHVRQVPAELVAVRRRWGRGGWVLAREAPAVNGAPVTMVRPNETIALSGYYG